MPISRKRRNAIELPRHVHVVMGRNRMPYYYYQPGRGTERARERIRLPNDVHSVEFWNALRQAQGLQSAATADGSLKAVSGEFLAHCAGRVANNDVAASTMAAYTRVVAMANDVWGDLPFAGLRSKHV